MYACNLVQSYYEMLNPMSQALLYRVMKFYIGRYIVNILIHVTSLVDNSFRSSYNSLTPNYTDTMLYSVYINNFYVLHF